MARRRGYTRRSSKNQVTILLAVVERAGVKPGSVPVLRLLDALIFGQGEAIEADVVLTTDGGWRCVSPRVQVVGR